MREALLALAIFSILVTPIENAAQAGESEDAAAFDYCAPPVRPTCVDDVRAFDDAARKRACEDAMAHYVSSVFAYRACMYAAIEKAIRQTNAASALLKCREARQTTCP